MPSSDGLVGYRILEIEDANGVVHGPPFKDDQIEGSKAVKIALFDLGNEENVKYFIVRHPSNFKTLTRLIFDIKLAADRYGFELVHA